MVEGSLDDMISEKSHTDAATVVNNNNKTTTVSKSGKAKLVILHETNNGMMKLTDTGLKSNNTLGAHVVEEK